MSGILIAFVSFFLTLNIANGVLLYIAQAFVAGGSIFGVSIYFRNQLGSFRSSAKNDLINLLKELLDNDKNHIEKDS